MIDLLVLIVAIFGGVFVAGLLWPVAFARAGHYVSTYCIHDLHESCRLTCKHCERYCRCRCHR